MNARTAARRRPPLVILCALAALVLARCTAPDIPGDPTANHGPPISLLLRPDNEVLQIDLNTEITRPFSVTVVYEDRTTRDVSAEATLTSKNPAAGRIQGAAFMVARMAESKVDFTTITAEYREGDKVLRAAANLTLVWLRTSGAAQDFFFTLPYMGPAEQKPLSFSTLIQSIDSFFAVDTTVSMAAAITQLRDSLQNTIIPGVSKAAVRGAWFGVGAVEDFPVSPYGKADARPGQADDQPFLLMSPMTADVSAAQAALGKLLSGSEPRGHGGDPPESQLEALYQIATGAGNVVPGVVNVPAHTGKGLGGVELRAGALPVITLVTDAMFHTKGEPEQSCTATTQTGIKVPFKGDYEGAVAAATRTRAETLTALQRICARVVGVSSLRTSIAGYVDDPAGICNATADLTSMAVGTGALVPPAAWDLPARPAGCPAGQCCTGLGGAGEAPNAGGLCPLVFKVAQGGGGLGDQVTSGISQVARFATFDVVVSTSGVTTSDMGEKLPMGRTTADFLRAVVPLSGTAPPAPPVLKAPVISGDRFTGVSPGSTVRFTVEARNDFLPPTMTPQVFHATIKIRAGGCADLDERDVLILIPPQAPIIG